MKNSIIIILFIIFPFSLLKSQVHQDWVANYNGPLGSEDKAFSVAVDEAGNVYVTGQSYGGTTGTSWDAATVKYNSNGIEQWSKRYAGTSSDIGKVIAVDASGNVYVAASSGQGANYSDYLTIKYNTNGVELWTSFYSGPTMYNDILQAMTIDAAGNVYVTGRSQGTTSPDDYLTVKYNTNGVQQWTARYNGPGDFVDIPYAIATSPDGSIYITGYSVGLATNNCTTIKYNSAGAEQWVCRYNSASYGNSVAVDAAGNVYVCGEIGTLTSSTNDFVTIKYNSAGVQQWANTYSSTGSFTDQAKFIKFDLLGNVIVTGNSYVAGQGQNFTTIKYNTAGVQQWITRYNGPSNYHDYTMDMVLDTLNNIYVTGLSYTNGATNDVDFQTVKYNSEGIQQWGIRYDGPGHKYDSPFAMTIDRIGNIYVAGEADMTGTQSYDYTTIKYSQGITGVNILSNEIPSKFSLSQNYPNPFNPNTNIEFALPEKSFVKLKVFDFLGREVSELVNENLSAGIYRYNFNGINLASGMYFYKLETEKFSETKKMILVK